MKLNKIERLKKRFSPYAYRERIHELDFYNLSEDDRFYLKNYGIYNIKLNEEQFMLRIRIAGGRIALNQLQQIIEIAKKYNLELLITARAQLELHGLASFHVIKVWKLLAQEKMVTLQTLTDNFRNIVTDPYDGVATESKIETYDLIEQMQNIFLNKSEWMGTLPRKFNTAICGTLSNSVHFFGNDLFFALAKKVEDWGFNLYLGGKNSAVAQDANIFILPQNVSLMFESVAKAYRVYGLRGSRSKTTLFHLLESIGIEVFVKKISQFYPEKMESKGQLSLDKNAPSSYQVLNDGSYGYCYQSRFGVIDLETWERLLSFAIDKKLQIRFGVDQNLYFLGLKEKSVPFNSLLGASNVTACAGSHYCALSLWDIKSETSYLPLKKIEKYNIHIGFSGCLKGCGRHYHCDIGLVGLRTNTYGKTQKAARVYLGGIYSRPGVAARLIFPVVPLEHLAALIEKMIESYIKSDMDDFESFSETCLNKFSTEFLMMWFLASLYLKEEIYLEPCSEEKLYQKLEQYPDFPSFAKDDKYMQSINIMKHALWDDDTIHTS